MAQTHLIGRTEKVARLRELLEEKRRVYLSCFFYSGKTELMNQLAERLSCPVLRYSTRQDDWAAFTREAKKNPDALLVIDDLQQLSIEVSEAMPGFLETLPDSQKVLMAGRAKVPDCLRSMIITGQIEVLDKDFVLFQSEEAKQLFLEYGLQLKSQDLAYVMKETWGSLCPSETM